MMKKLPNNFFFAHFQEIYLAQFNEATRQKTSQQMEQELIQLDFPAEILEETKKIGHYGFQKLAKKWNPQVISQLITAANSRWELVFEQTLTIQRYPGFYKSWILEDLQLSSDVLLAKNSIDFLAENQQENLCKKLLIGAIYNLFQTTFSATKISKDLRLNPQILVSEAIEMLMTFMVCTPWRKCYQIIESEQLQTISI